MLLAETPALEVTIPPFTGKRLPTEAEWEFALEAAVLPLRISQ